MPVAMITGASKGLGRALAAALAQRGWDLVLGARTASVLEETAKELAACGARVAAVPGDVTDAAHRGALVAAAGELGGLDLLVSNASALGAEPLVRLDALSLGGLRQALETNVVAALGLVQGTLPLLRASAAGAVVVVRPAGRGAGGGGAGAARVGGRSGRHADRSLCGGGAGGRGSAAASGERGARVPAAAGASAGERAVCGTCADRDRGGAVTALDALTVPPDLSARVPAEQRGVARDDVRMLMSRGREVSHHVFRELPGLLRAGDVLVVNTSATLPAAVNGRAGGTRVVVHFSTRGGDGRWAVELRDPDGTGATVQRRGGPTGTVVQLPGGSRLVLQEPLGGAAAGARLWWARVSTEVPGLLRRYGRPIRYGYTERDQPLSAYQTVFVVEAPDGSGSAEMPSAARPFTPRMVAALVRRGVQFAPLTLHTGVASAEGYEPPYPERFEVPRTDGLAGQRGAGDGRAGDRGRYDGGAGAGVVGGRGRGGAAGGRLDGSGGDAAARGAGGGRAADRAARAGGLASADAGGGRGAGRAAVRIPGGTAAPVPLA